MHTTPPTRRRLARPRIRFTILLVASLVLLTACGDEQPTSTTNTGETNNGSFHAEATDWEDLPLELKAAVVAAHNRLGMLVFQQLLSQSDVANAGYNDSVFISPTSIALALGMAYNGADGETEEALAEAMQLADLLRAGLSRHQLNAANLALLHALDGAASAGAGADGVGADGDANAAPNDIDESRVRLDIANSIWYRRELAFNQAFMRENEHYYRAVVAGLDFDAPESVDTINDWVSNATEGLIPSVVDQLDEDQIMMLINAVYFRGDWTTPFDKHLTRDMPFQLASGDSRAVPMMYRAGRIDYYEGDFQAIRLPYGDNERLAMYVFLPPADADFHEFVGEFTYETMSQTFDRFRPAQGEVVLPRMDISYKSKLNEALKALGMGIAFDGGAADFGRMRPADETRNVYISDVIHQSVLKIDERGTEAAAVTSVDFRVTSVPVYEFMFKADRPFLIAIRDDHTEALLFIGAVMNPEGAVQ